MNHRESLRQIVNFERPEDVCLFEPGYWPETVARWKTEGMPASAEPWDPVGITCYKRVPAKVRFWPEFEPKLIEERDGHEVRQNENGIVYEVAKGQTNFPHFIRHPVQNMDDFDRLRERLDANTPGRFPADWPAACQKLSHRDYILVMGFIEISFFGWPRDLMGVENLLMAYYDQPELIHAINRQHLEFVKTIYTRIARDVQFDFIFFWEDMAFKNGPLISPALFREFMLPYYQELIPYLKKLTGCKVILDSDGDITKLISLFIEGGVDGLLPFEVAAGMDIRKVAAEYPKLIISGGIDKREIAKGPAAIDRELEAKLPTMFRRGGYLPSMDHHVPPEVSYDNFRYYVNKVREIYRRCR